MNKCFRLECDNLTSNKYCSRRCANTVNNSIFPKRRAKIKICSLCEKELAGQNKYHKECYEKEFYHNYDNLTLSDFKKSCGRNSYSSMIHIVSRKISKKLGKLDKCFTCGYKLHIECCHIKGVMSFPLDTLVSVVNHPDNLVGLCPNHHWEFDNGYLIL